MAFTYDFNSAPQVSLVRMYVPDTTAPGIFSDDEINQALSAESSAGIYASGQLYTGSFAPSNTTPIVYSPRRAAAMLLDILASRLSRAAAIEQLLDVKQDCKTAAQEARASAKALRDTEAHSGNFAIAEWNINQFTGRERIFKVLQRLAGS